MQPDPILSVSQLIEAINITLDALGPITVEGEVDEFKIIHNKWVTFRLKDETSSVGCFMTVWQLKTQLEDGMLVRATGQPKLREKGFFSFVLQSVQPAGEGALRRAFELLKQKLEGEGVFAAERKRPLPKFPQHIALITSRDAAAYADFLKILQARHGGLTISFIHTQVQGADAPRQLIAALTTANSELPDLDVIVMVRGGGSLEDLQAFNDETVIRAVAASRTPIIVGVGHERDITLAELAADVRASTPSNAAELLVASRQEVLAELERWKTVLRSHLQASLTERSHRIGQLVHALRSRLASNVLRINTLVNALQGTSQRLHQYAAERQRRLITVEEHMRHRMSQRISAHRDQLAQLTRLLRSLSPDATLQRGYSITRTAHGGILKRAADAAPGELITTQLKQGSIASRVESA